MLQDFFKKTRYINVKPTHGHKVSQNNEKQKRPVTFRASETVIPDGLWVKCDRCNSTIYNQDLKDNSNVCPNCNKHFRIGSYERIEMLVDEGTFTEYDADMESKNVLEFPKYDEKVATYQAKTGLKSAVMTGQGNILGNEAVIVVMDSKFMMGSMGRVVGEKITRAIERATKERLPIIIFTASGGARMQEGIFSLMQMAKTSAALAKHSEASLPYIAVLTDPTTGGVTASFAMLGDIILAEPEVLVGFAGRRVIEQTIKQELPEGFQTSEFLLEKGFIDSIIHRKNMKEVLSKLIYMHKESL